MDKNRLNNPRLRLVVPLRLRARVLTANHDAPSAGHVGFDKTYAALQSLYFWFGMYADTKAWVASCPSCAKGKRRTIAGHGTAKHFTKDTDKYNLATVLGWRVIRVTALNYTTVLKTLNEMAK